MKMLLVLSVCILGLGIQSCSDVEEGLAVGAIAGGIIGSHISSGHRHYQRCYHCYRPYGGYYGYALEDAANNENVRVAQKYNIPIESANMIVESLHRAESKDYTGLSDWGLGQKDFVAFYNNEDLSDAAISNISKKLGFSEDETQDLVADMSADIQAEKIRRNIH